MHRTKLRNRIAALERVFKATPVAPQPVDLRATVGKLLEAFGYPGCRVIRQEHESEAEAFCRTVQIEPRGLKGLLMQRLARAGSVCSVAQTSGR